MAAYEGLNNACIYDFETLAQDQMRGVVVSMAMLSFAESRFTNPDIAYTYEELVDSAKFIKFDVEDQVKTYKRSIDKNTLKWWDQQGAEAKKQLKPSDEDQSIAKLFDFFVLNKSVNVKKIYTRGNTFDPIFMEHIMKQTGYPDPYPWWEVRDTRSVIEGLSWGSDLKNSFMPPNCEDKFVHHDPRHDIALDVMRLQTLVQAIA